MQNYPISSALPTKQLRRQIPFLVASFGFLVCAVCFLPACESSGEKSFDQTVNAMIQKAQGRSNVDVAADLFNTGSPDARRGAIAEIQKKSWGHDEPLMKAYHTLTTDPEPLVRGQAYRALGSSKQPAVAPDLITGLSDKEVTVRRDAAEAMCDIHNDTLIIPLIDHLHTDTDPQVRVSCTRALIGYNTPRVLRALAEALDDQDVAVIQYAYKALKTTTGQQFDKAPQPWIDYINARFPTTRPT